jgi:hypothetical protein
MAMAATRRFTEQVISRQEASAARQPRLSGLLAHHATKRLTAKQEPAPQAVSRHAGPARPNALILPPPSTEQPRRLLTTAIPEPASSWSWHGQEIHPAPEPASD